MSGEAATYSRAWFELFAESVDPAQTRREVEFIARHLPPATHRRVLDICCGTGRHAEPLARLGYSVTGIDVSEPALEAARARLGGDGLILAHDMRQIDRLPGRFDAAILLWQSFGYFDDATNRDVLRQIADRLSPAGRFVLDIYHREFFDRHAGTVRHQRFGRTIIETKHMDETRLTVQLCYDDGSADRFEWRLYTPAEVLEMARVYQLAPLAACSDFDESHPPAPQRPRMQFVFEKS